MSDVPETKEEDGEVHEYAAPKSTNTQNGENTDKGNKLEDIKEQKQNGMVIITKIEKKKMMTRKKKMMMKMTTIMTMYL